MVRKVTAPVRSPRPTTHAAATRTLGDVLGIQVSTTPTRHATASTPNVRLAVPSR